MTEFNPNHPEVKKKVEKYIADSLGMPVEFILALPVKGGSPTLSWRVELTAAEKQLFILLKTPKQEIITPAGTSKSYDFFRQYRLLKQLETTKLKTPKVFGLDEKGAALGLPSFLEESLKGRVLYNFLKLKEKWADELFIKTIIEIQSLKKEELGTLAAELEQGEEIKSFFARVKAEMREFTKGPLLTGVIKKLSDNLPSGLPLCFGNGDFNPKNIIVKEKKLSGVIDFEFAGFFDPLYEFLFPFERYPLLKNRGLEEEYCRQTGFDVKITDWYRGFILIVKLLELLKYEKTNTAFQNDERNIKEELLSELSKWDEK